MVDNINERDLCLIIYKAGASLYPKYRDLLGTDIEDFQQICAMLSLKNLKNYDKDKGAISTFIYNSLPLLIRRYLISKEAKTIIIENNKINLDNLYHYTELNNEDKFSRLFVSEENIADEYSRREIVSVIGKISKNYPVMRRKIHDDLTFPQLAKKLKMTERQVKYRYCLELTDMISKYENILKSLYYL